MGKDMKGRNLGEGIYQRNGDKYSTRFICRSGKGIFTFKKHTITIKRTMEFRYGDKDFKYIKEK